jgi:hypothetical protein
LSGVERHRPAFQKKKIYSFFLPNQIGPQTWAGPGAEGRPPLRSSEAEGIELDPGTRGQTSSALRRARLGDRAERPRPDGLRPGAIGACVFFFFKDFRSDLVVLDLVLLVKNNVHSRRLMENKQGSNKDEIRDEDTEKNEGPRLLQIG